MNTRFGNQPALGFLKTRGITYQEAAEYCGVSKLHLQHVCYGRLSPAPQIIERLPKLLGMPIQCLLNEDVLASEYDARKGPAPRRQQGIKPNDLVFSDSAVDAAFSYLKATEAN